MGTKVFNSIARLNSCACTFIKESTDSKIPVSYTHLQSPTLSLSPDDFVILLTHTPDYAEEVSITNTDLVLAGHTHGGQVTLFGLYAPIIPSRYGQRFLSLIHI